MWILGILVVSAVALVGFAALRPRARVMSRAEFLPTLEAWVSDTLAAGDWDYLECCSLSDPQLEAARTRCAAISLDPALTLNPQESWRLNPAGKLKVQELILELRGHGSAAA
jgi:hypothetical protein